MNELRERIPDCAKDLRLNLDALQKIESLSAEQLWGTLLAAALAARNAELSAAVAAEARSRLAPEAFRAAQAAAAIMGMNNVYYRFQHLASNKEYEGMPARLRMQALANHGTPKLDFELAALAVSAVHGCGKCIDAHERELRQAGASSQQIHDAVRIAAVLHGIAGVLDAERALATIAPAA